MEYTYNQWKVNIGDKSDINVIIKFTDTSVTLPDGYCYALVSKSFVDGFDFKNASIVKVNNAFPALTCSSVGIFAGIYHKYTNEELVAKAAAELKAEAKQKEAEMLVTKFAEKDQTDNWNLFHRATCTIYGQLMFKKQYWINTIFVHNVADGQYTLRYHNIADHETNIFMRDGKGILDSPIYTDSLTMSSSSTCVNFAPKLTHRINIFVGYIGDNDGGKK